MMGGGIEGIELELEERVALVRERAKRYRLNLPATFPPNPEPHGYLGRYDDEYAHDGVNIIELSRETPRSDRDTYSAARVFVISAMCKASSTVPSLLYTTWYLEAPVDFWLLKYLNCRTFKLALTFKSTQHSISLLSTLCCCLRHYLGRRSPQTAGSCLQVTHKPSLSASCRTHIPTAKMVSFLQASTES